MPTRSFQTAVRTDMYVCASRYPGTRYLVLWHLQLRVNNLIVDKASTITPTCFYRYSIKYKKSQRPLTFFLYLSTGMSLHINLYFRHFIDRVPGTWYGVAGDRVPGTLVPVPPVEPL